MKSLLGSIHCTPSRRPVKFSAGSQSWHYLVFDRSISREDRLLLLMELFAYYKWLVDPRVVPGFDAATYLPEELVEVRVVTDPRHPAFGQAGLYARRQIASNTVVTPYSGIVEIFGASCNSRTYTMGFGSISDDYALDAEFCGNYGRFANDPRGVEGSTANLSAESKYNARGESYTALVARRQIAEGEEVLMAYGKAHSLAASPWSGVRGEALMRRREGRSTPLPVFSLNVAGEQRTNGRCTDDDGPHRDASIGYDVMWECPQCGMWSRCQSPMMAHVDICQGCATPKLSGARVVALLRSSGSSSQGGGGAATSDAPSGVAVGDGGRGPRAAAEFPTDPLPSLGAEMGSMDAWMNTLESAWRDGGQGNGSGGPCSSSSSSLSPSAGSQWSSRSHSGSAGAAGSAAVTTTTAFPSAAAALAGPLTGAQQPLSRKLPKKKADTPASGVRGVAGAATTATTAEATCASPLLPQSPGSPLSSPNALRANHYSAASTDWPMNVPFLPWQVWDPSVPLSALEKHSRFDLQEHVLLYNVEEEEEEEDDDSEAEAQSSDGSTTAGSHSSSSSHRAAPPEPSHKAESRSSSISRGSSSSSSSHHHNTEKTREKKADCSSRRPRKRPDVTATWRQGRKKRRRKQSRPALWEKQGAAELPAMLFSRVPNRSAPTHGGGPDEGKWTEAAPHDGNRTLTGGGDACASGVRSAPFVKRDADDALPRETEFYVSPMPPFSKTLNFQRDRERFVVLHTSLFHRGGGPLGPLPDTTTTAAAASSSLRASAAPLETAKAALRSMRRRPFAGKSFRPGDTVAYVGGCIRPLRDPRCRPEYSPLAIPLIYFAPAALREQYGEGGRQRGEGEEAAVAEGLRDLLERLSQLCLVVTNDMMLCPVLAMAAYCSDRETSGEQRNAHCIRREVPQWKRDAAALLAMCNVALVLTLDALGCPYVGAVATRQISAFEPLLARVQ